MIEVHDGVDDQSSGAFLWEAEDSGGDSRKSKTGEIVVGREPQGSVYRIQKLLVLLPLAPDGSDGVDDVTAAQASSRCDCREIMSYWSVLAHPLIALNLNLRPAAADDRPGNAATVLELSVGGIHNSIHIRFGDVAVDYAQFLPLRQLPLQN